MFKPLITRLKAPFARTRDMPAYALAEVHQAYLDQEKAEKKSYALLQGSSANMVGCCAVGVALALGGAIVWPVSLLAAATVVPLAVAGFIQGRKASTIQKRLRETQEHISPEDMLAAYPAAQAAKLVHDKKNRDALNKKYNLMQLISTVTSFAAVGALGVAAFVAFGAAGAVAGSAAYVTAQAVGFSAYGVWSLSMLVNKATQRLQKSKAEALLYDCQLGIIESNKLMAAFDTAEKRQNSPAADAKPGQAFDAAATPAKADTPAPEQPPAQKPTKPAVRKNTPPK